MLHQPFFVPASIILLLSLPLIFGLIPPNPIYGVRTAETLADRDLWYRANRYGGWTLAVSSILYLGIAAIFPSVGIDERALGLWLLQLVVFVGPLIISLLLIRNYIKKS
jgi:uncharacterized membrane protein